MGKTNTTLGVCRVVLLLADAARSPRKGCLAVTVWLTGNKRLQRRSSIKASVTVQVAPGDKPHLAAVGLVFQALAVTLTACRRAKRPTVKLKKPCVNALLGLIVDFFPFLRRDGEDTESSQLRCFSDPYLKVF